MGFEDFTAGFFVGFIATAFIVFLSWYVPEIECEQKSGAVDCEWLLSPMTPVNNLGDG